MHPYERFFHLSWACLLQDKKRWFWLAWLLCSLPLLIDTRRGNVAVSTERHVMRVIGVETVSHS